MGRVKGVSFDLWDTVIADDSDEPKRRDQGLPPKRVARRELLWRALEAQGPIPRERVDCAYDTADAAFRRVWHEQHVTWSVRERLEVVLAGLGRSLPEPELAELVRAHEEMELAVRPDPVPGALEGLRSLTGRWPLVVLSDAIFSPGWALRRLLEGWGVAELFAGFAFSDELGCSKPAPEAFRRAAELAGCALEELVHIGDREHNDIAGPRALGARAVLITAAVDRGSEQSRADAICRDWSELPAILEALDRA